MEGPDLHAIEDMELSDDELYGLPDMERRRDPDLYAMPDISVKVRRSLARRVAAYGSIEKARPIYFNTETALNALYDKSKSETYIEQVFTCVEKIGQGCFGDVYRAISRDNSEPYAIKVTNDTHVILDLGEVRRLEKIPDHPHCVKFYRAWRENFRLYIQMELCMVSLDRLILIDLFIPEPQIWEILTDICEGLKHLHKHELIHLDIKPANIMVTQGGVCKLGDFGLMVDLTDVDPITLKRLRSGLSVSEGDGKYVAMEVLRQYIYTKAADIFSLGLMMIQLASNVALPSSGVEWEKIREGVMPEVYKKRRLTRNFRSLIKKMVIKNHLLRPSIDGVMNNFGIKGLRRCRKTCPRFNYMADWEERWDRYVIESSAPRMDNPAQQVDGPSPPRRRYPIAYVSPRSPRRGAQLFRATTPTNEAGEPSTSRIPTLTEERYAGANRIARRLFD